jgi:hypothetical protein
MGGRSAAPVVSCLWTGNETQYRLLKAHGDVNVCSPFFANCWVARDKFMKLAKGETCSMRSAFGDATEGVSWIEGGIADYRATNAITMALIAGCRKYRLRGILAGLPGLV